MEIPIELLAFGIPVLIFLVWKTFFLMLNFIDRRRYKPEHDKSRRFERRESTTETTNPVLPGYRKPEKQGSVQLPGDNGTKGNKTSVRKVRNPFRRR